MKIDIWKVLIVIALGAILFLTITNSCKEQPSLDGINQAFTENQKQIENLNNEIKSLRNNVDEALKHIDSLNRSNEKTIKRFSYEISKMDELFKNSSDTLIVNSVIRYWADRLYGLPEFFQTGTPNF